MANFTINGKLIEKYDTQQVSDSFQKREFVLEISEEGNNGMVYTNFASFQLVQNNVSMIDSYNVGDELKVSFGIRGNKWERKDGEIRYITNLNAWRVESAQAGAPQANQAPPPQQQATTQAPPAPTTPPVNLDNDVDDLPF